MRNSPSCNCCGVMDCVYAVSDGCIYYDDFATLDSGWLTGVGSPVLSIVSGRLRVAPGSGFGAQLHTYRTLSLSTSTTWIIAEVLTQAEDGAALLIGDGTNIDIFAILPKPGTSDYAGKAFGNSFSGVGPVPAAGQKLTIIVEQISGTTYRACMFVNGTLIHTENATFDLTDLTRYGLAGLAGGTADYDNFRISSSHCCCADAAPATLEATISGVNSGTTNITLDAGTCTIECDQLNDDYVFTQSAPCQWSTTRDWDVTCGGTPTTETFTLFLYFQTVSGTQYLYFLIKTGSNYVQYLARTPVPDDCCDLATYIIELSSYLSSSFCTANLVAASELEITASTCV